MRLWAALRISNYWQQTKPASWFLGGRKLVQAAHPTLTAKQEEELEKIIDRYREAGLLSYEELDQQLPVDIQNPDLIDVVLTKIEEQGIELGDDAEIRTRE